MTRRNRLRAREGMTLIEMMIVVLILALVAGGITYSIGALTRTRLRSACVTTSAAARYAYNRSIAENSTVRLVFDRANDQMSFEEAHGRVTLTRLNDARRGEIAEDEDGTAVDPWEAARARLEDTLRPSFGASPFSAIAGRRFEARPLAPGVTIERLIVPHEPEPRTEGRGAIYFFPGGQTEHAILWLADGSDHVYSVEIHPLTGRGRVYDYAYEPEEMLDDGEGNERSEVED